MRRNPQAVAHEMLVRLGQPDGPVDLEHAAALMHVSIIARKLPASTSGMLIRTPEGTVIGVNANHPDVRRRFSIAHELGHLVLHPGRPLFLHETVRVNYRDETSSKATDLEEIEANAFAAALLMPESTVRRLTERVGGSDRQGLILELAKALHVSRLAMEIRLVNLGILQPA